MKTQSPSKANTLANMLLLFIFWFCGWISNVCFVWDSGWVLLKVTQLDLFMFDYGLKIILQTYFHFLQKYFLQAKASQWSQMWE